MYTVEFETKIDNGIVHIPARYEKLQNSNHAKIIIMVDDKREIKDSLALQRFLAQGKKVDNIAAFDRVELHD